MNTKNHKKYLSTFSLYGCKKSQCVHQLASSKALSHKNFVEMNTDTKKWLMCPLLTIYVHADSVLHESSMHSTYQSKHWINSIFWNAYARQRISLNHIFPINSGSLLNVLWCQLIKLIQFVSTSKFREYWWNDIDFIYFVPFV